MKVQYMETTKNVPNHQPIGITRNLRVAMCEILKLDTLWWTNIAMENHHF